MRFYQGLLPAIIWDQKIGAPKVEFNNRIFDTDDEDIIAFLHKEGYLVEADVRVLEAGGNIDHGGFEPQESKDKDLPSGKLPMDNPEMAPGGQPQKRERTNLPDSEQEDIAKASAGGLADVPDAASSKRPRRTIARRDKK